MKKLIVTRQEEGIVGDNVEVIAHASPETVTNRHVIGVLPHSLSCLTASFTEVPLSLPPELRGKELTAGDVRKYAGKPVTYIVRRCER